MDEQVGSDPEAPKATFSGVEGEYTAYMLVVIKGYGDPKVNQEATLAAIRREVKLNYGERAKIFPVEEGLAIQLLEHTMEPEEVPEVDSEETMS